MSSSCPTTNPQTFPGITRKPLQYTAPQQNHNATASSPSNSTRWSTGVLRSLHRWSYTLAERGYFTPFNQESEIWLLDLKTMRRSHPRTVNSNSTESNHNWSHNGKWLVVGSKFPDRLFTKPYFAHFDPQSGTFDKRFVLPQEDPDFYGGYTANFNNADFITGVVPVSENEIRDAVRGELKQVKEK